MASLRASIPGTALAEAGLPVICVETRHMKAALSAQINKSDRYDARRSILFPWRKKEHAASNL
jgi:transposase